jgi:hypothetical protein
MKKERMLTNEGTWESKEKVKVKANNAKFKQNMFFESKYLCSAQVENIFTLLKSLSANLFLNREGCSGPPQLGVGIHIPTHGIVVSGTY